MIYQLQHRQMMAVRLNLLLVGDLECTGSLKSAVNGSHINKRYVVFIVNIVSV